MTNTSHSEQKPQLLPCRHVPLWSIISSQLPPSPPQRERAAAPRHSRPFLQGANSRRFRTSLEKGRFAQGAAKACLQGEGLCFASASLVDAKLSGWLTPVFCGLWLSPQIQLWRTRLWIQSGRSCCLSAANASDVLQVSSASARCFR